VKLLTLSFAEKPLSRTFCSEPGGPML
jgi:hypothetical protein